MSDGARSLLLGAQGLLMEDLFSGSNTIGKIHLIHVPERRQFQWISNSSGYKIHATIEDCELYESRLMDAAQPAIAYYTARLLQDEIRDPKANNNKKGARL